MGCGLVRDIDDARALARQCRLPSIAGDAGLALRPIAPFPEPHRLLKAPLLIPLTSGPADLVVNAECFTPETLAALATAIDPRRERIAVADSATLRDAVARTYGSAIAEDAANGLARRYPRFSAAFGMAAWQRVFLSLAGGLFVGAALFTPREATALYSACLSLMFLLTILLRIAAAAFAFLRQVKGNGPPRRRPRDRDLPAYTVLVAMYRETAVLRDLVDGLKALNYPALGSKSTNTSPGG
jgi:hypothetical protein